MIVASTRSRRRGNGSKQLFQHRPIILIVAPGTIATEFKTEIEMNTIRLNHSKTNRRVGAAREIADGLDTHPTSDVPSIVPQSIHDQRTETISLSEQLLDEWNHRLKNNLQILVGLLESGYRKARNPEAREVLSDAIGRIGAIGTAQRAYYCAPGSTDVNGHSDWSGRSRNGSEGASVWSELRERVAQYDSRTSDMRLRGGGVSPKYRSTSERASCPNNGESQCVYLNSFTRSVLAIALAGIAAKANAQSIDELYQAAKEEGALSLNGALGLSLPPSLLAWYVQPPPRRAFQK